MSFDFDFQYRKEWRLLGFYYEFNNLKNCWIFVGSKSGLLNFCKLLLNYASDKSHEKLSEHEHFGPDSYLKVITWDAPIIKESGIYGSIRDIKRLSYILKEKLINIPIKMEIKIDKEYSNVNECYILLRIKSDNFDPATCYKPGQE